MMELPKDFVEKLAFIHPKEIAAELKKFGEAPDPNRGGGAMWFIKNEVRPVDIYCYCGARFGQPNGFQNFLRADNSSNLIHWEWELRHERGTIKFFGMNFRTEVWLTGYKSLGEADRQSLIDQLKVEFSRHGQAMGKVRKALEHWIEFVIPYQRLRHSINSLAKELDSLGLDPEPNVPDILGAEDMTAATAIWKEQTEKYNRAIGLAFGIRSMLPVMAEAFVNLLHYILMKPDLRKDERLRENAIRQPIDIRIRSLSHNCGGFKEAVDYESDACKKYHSLVIERNDLLHGNVVIDKLKFNELHFWGTVPVFIKYSSMWDRSLGVSHQTAGVAKVKEETEIVEGLVAYLLSCLKDELRENVKLLTDRLQLGLNLKTGRVGLLFPDFVVDMMLVIKPGSDGEGPTAQLNVVHDGPDDIMAEYRDQTDPSQPSND